MKTLSTLLQQESVAPFTHIFLSLDLMDSGLVNEEHRLCLTIIRENTERLQRLIQNVHADRIPG